MINLKSAGALALLMASGSLAACTREAAPADVAPAAQMADCVELTDGTYQIIGGRILVSRVPMEAAPAPFANPAWADAVMARFAGEGFGWMGLTVRDRVAAVTGLAPEADTKRRGMAFAESALQAAGEAAPAGLLVVDAITLADSSESGPGEAIADLARGEVTMARCQAAFEQAMQGRTILFQSDRADISPVSARLLDAVTGAATLCSSFPIEIGGHSDSSGSPEYNRLLSQQRADEVLRYMSARGVPAEQLVAIGYGSARPIETGRSPEAQARNRRIEFRVLDQPPGNGQ